jgi:DNA-binding MarR family transcriptional regulator
MRRNDAETMAMKVATQCLAGRISQVSRVVLGHYDRVFRKLGITANQITMLSAIAILRKCTLGDLEPVLLMDRSTLSRNVERLITAGWVIKLPGPDRRSAYLVLSPGGEEVLAKASPLWDKAHAWMLKLLKQDGARSVYRVAKLVNPRLLR